MTRTTADVLDQTPPCDPQAEAAVLAAVLTQPAMMERVLAIVTAGDFRDPWNRRVFDHLEWLHRNERIDVTLLKARAEADGGWSGEDGARVLELFSVPVFSKHVENYSRIVRGKAALRAIIQAGLDFATGAYERGADPSLLAAEAVEHFKNIAQPLAAGCAETERIADVEPETLKWLWPGRVALGKLTLFAGDPGLGKSLITLDMAARVSAGFAWPDGAEPAEPAGVVLVNAEDDLGDTVRPRLDAARADVERIVALKAVRSVDDDGRRVSRGFTLADLDALREAIDRTPDCRLVIIDPVSAYCGRVDSHSNTDIRALLGPLAELAAEKDVAVVCVTHLNKNAAGPAIYRSMGSLAFIAAARAAWAITKDKADPRRRLMLPLKNNLAAEQSGLAYGIVEVDGQPVLAWESEPVEVTVDEALQPEKPEGRGGARRLADQWLQEVLADGPVEAAIIVESGKVQGFGEKALRGAADRLGVDKVRTGFGPGAKWTWRLGDGSIDAPIDSLDAPSQG